MELTECIEEEVLAETENDIEVPHFNPKPMKDLKQPEGKKTVIKEYLILTLNQ